MKTTRVDSLLEALGWHSAAVFRPGMTSHGDGSGSIMLEKSIVAMEDPYPEFKEISILSGEYHHTGALLRGEYESVLTDRMDSHGEAEIVPIAEVDGLGRDEDGRLSVDKEVIPDGI